MRQGVTRSIFAALALGATLIGCSPSDRVIATTTAPTVDAVPLAIGPAVGYSASSYPSPDDALSIGSAAIDTTGGSIPDGQMVSPFDVGNPVVGLLDPLLLKAIQDAARAAADDGVELRLTSGWRSRGFQKRLFRRAVTTYEQRRRREPVRRITGRFDAREGPGSGRRPRGRRRVDDPQRGAVRPVSDLCQRDLAFERAVDAAGNCPRLRPNAAG